MLDKLYDEAERDNIRIYSVGMNSVTAISAPCGSGYVIGINSNLALSTAQETVCLAHEIGHCKTGSFYTSATEENTVRRYEAKANAWAYKRLIPLEELQTLCDKGTVERWEIAEHFGVTEEFLEKALKYYCLL